MLVDIIWKFGIYGLAILIFIGLFALVEYAVYCIDTSLDMGVSKNSDTPKSSILIGFSIINHPFWGTTILGNTHIPKYSRYFLNLPAAETFSRANPLEIVQLFSPAGRRHDAGRIKGFTNVEEQQKIKYPPPRN